MDSLTDAGLSDRISLPTLPPGEQRVVLQARLDEGALDRCPPPPSPPTALRRRSSRSPSPAPAPTATATATATLAWLSVLLACVRLSVIRRGAGWRSGWLVCLLLAAPQHYQPCQPCQPYLPGTVPIATFAQAWAAPRDPRMVHKPAVNVSLLRNRIDPVPVTFYLFWDHEPRDGLARKHSHQPRTLQKNMTSLQDRPDRKPLSALRRAWEANLLAGSGLARVLERQLFALWHGVCTRWRPTPRPREEFFQVHT
ncbi:hypothetical protein GTA08_BOTSDO12692 [Botryosphaeria dothidea]|uniref:Uncharacterized protein n=1 Tax=Botryosphaeria dothidea TaxID=55169 RepID=A0A8H4J2G5_9PEZI|nr:hypothetical protein GTA08_BOTSDO12692 [Botryosphaeria dothidea]